MAELLPIPTFHLFPLLDDLLIDLLQNLEEEEWNLPTVAPQWTVKDVASHLLDGNLRMLSVLRDGHLQKPSVAPDSYAALVQYLNSLNAGFVEAFKRVSPRVLIDLLANTGKSCSKMISMLNPHEPAVFPVSWAGHQQSPNWFHIAREYTEKWHHQQQIRAAVNREAPLYARELHHPFLQVVMQALPHRFGQVDAGEGCQLKIEVSGQGGGSWFLKRTGNHWQFAEPGPQPPEAVITIPENWAWRIFMNAAPAAEAKQHTTITGNTRLGLAVLDTRAVMV